MNKPEKRSERDQDDEGQIRAESARGRERDEFPSDTTHHRGGAMDEGPGPDRQTVEDRENTTDFRGKHPIEPAEGRRDVGPDRKASKHPSS